VILATKLQPFFHKKKYNAKNFRRKLFQNRQECTLSTAGSFQKRKAMPHYLLEKQLLLSAKTQMTIKILPQSR